MLYYLKKYPLTWTTIGVIIYLLMLLPIVQYLLLALAWQGVLVTAWVAIAVVHVVLDRGRHQEHASIGDKSYRAFNSNGLVAWTIGTVIGFVMLQLGTINPDLGGIGSTWGPILTAVSSAAIYGILWKTNPSSRTGLIKVVA